METRRNGRGCETQVEFDSYWGEFLTRLKNLKVVVKRFGADPLCRFFNTLKFAERVGLAQLDL